MSHSLRLERYRCHILSSKKDGMVYILIRIYLFILFSCKLSSSGLYIDGSLIRKGKTRVLRWGNQIAGGPEGSELFVYTYKLPKDVRTIIATERAKYELEDEELAHGMYSKVYKARDLEHNEVYACKVTNRLARDYNPAELASMEHEIELLKDLSHVRHFRRLFNICKRRRPSALGVFVPKSVDHHSFISVDL